MRVLPLPALTALLCAGAAWVLALNYPLGPALALTIVLACSACITWRTEYGLFLLAVLPLAAFAPWSGWITFEEMDMLVLAVAAGAYAHLAWNTGPDTSREPAAAGKDSNLLLVGILGVAFASSLAVAMYRGFLDAGGFTFGWFQGYHEPMNSVRQAKPFFLALLLLPWWLSILRRNPKRAAGLLVLAIVVGLGAGALATVWERLAFTGLSDFSSDYRTTGLFWEMHVGGAALDGFLAMATPFAILAMLRARTPMQWTGAAAVLALTTYACLTTFSRALYLAIPVGLVVLSVLLWVQGRRQARALAAVRPLDDQQNEPQPAPTVRSAGLSVLLVIGFSAGAAWAFQSSGYRGMFALLGACALLLPLVNRTRQLPARLWAPTALLGLGMAALAWSASWLIPKGAYVAWMIAATITAAALAHTPSNRGRSQLSAAVATGAFMALLACTALVALHWGGTAGALGMAWPLLGLAVAGVAACASTSLRWPTSYRWQLTTVALMGVAAFIIGVLSGGAYMVNRFATGERDLDWRRAHWQTGVDMLRTPADWALGKGIGRFPANYFAIGKPEQHPGDYRLRYDGDNAHLTLTGGLHTNGWGEIFRVTQRIAAPGHGAWVAAKVRAPQDASLHFEICEKHLLYGQNCVGRDIAVKAAPGVWQDIKAQMRGSTAPGHGEWYAPRFVAFSVAMESRGRLVDLDDLELTDVRGTPLLSNGDFTREMAHWYFSSDKHHLPWHMKNLFAHVLFEQGLLGVALFGLLLTMAFWRTAVGSAQAHPLAPALAASLAGFTTVGLFDSLLDVPRVAWLFYLLVLIALTLPRSISGTRPARNGTTARSIGMGLSAVCVLIWSSAPANVLAAEIAVPQAVIQVGPDRAVRSLAEAATLARDGATIEVDAGEYGGDVAVWTQDRLTIKAVGGRVVLTAQGQSAQGKAIWVMRGGAINVQGFDFTGAQVPDHNGAGIRLETGKLLVRDCRFVDNENGILTSNQADVELDIIDSEFAHNGYGDGYSHNLYVGAIARLSVTGSYFHHANLGHLLKSRARHNEIRYNRLADEPGGRASYELEFPNGGIAHVVGNIIVQEPKTENPNIISYGAEGYRWPNNRLILAHNTIVDRRTQGGTFLKVKPADVQLVAVNNLLVGRSSLQSAGPGDYRGNVVVELDSFEPGPPDEYRLRSNVRWNGRLADPGSIDGITLAPQSQFRRPRGTQPIVGKPNRPGALQPRHSNSGS